MLWIVKKPNEKALKICNRFLWEVIYVHFYNWDRPLELVLVVYDLIKLIIEVSLWIKDYSTFDNHTRRTRLLFSECLFSFVWLYMIKCDVYTQLLVDQTQFFFLIILYVFESVFMLLCFEFLFKLHFSCFSSKTSSEAFSLEARD